MALKRWCLVHKNGSAALKVPPSNYSGAVDHRGKVAAANDHVQNQRSGLFFTRKDQRVKPSQSKDYSLADPSHPPPSSFLPFGQKLDEISVAHVHQAHDEYNWYGTITRVENRKYYVIWDELSDAEYAYTVEELRNLGETRQQKQARQQRMKANGEGRFAQGRLF